LREAGSYEALFRTGFSFDTPNAINLDLMKEHLVSLKKGECIVSPRYDFVTCESFEDGELKKPARILLTEGLYVLHETMRDIVDVKVYVSTPLDVLKTRWYKRAASRGKTGEAADSQYKDVNKTAQLYIRPTMDISDVVINGLVEVGYIQNITDRIFSVIENAY
jgi:uridine kinase